MADYTKVPEAINDFNVYNNGSKMIGVSGEVSLATISSITQTVSGPGVLGEYDAAIIGHFSNIDQEIPFRMLDEDAAALMVPGSPVNITLRAAEQLKNRSDSTTTYKGVRFVVKGQSKEFQPGTIKQGAQMDSKVTVACTYILYEVDGKKLFELDKLNGIFIVNGQDQLAAIKALC